jgi:hypothetical protein
MARLRVASLPGILGFLVLAAGLLAVAPVSNSARLKAAEEPQTSAEESKAAAEARFYTALEADVTQGALRFQGEDGAVVECPLKHTDVKAEVSGFIAR